MRDLFVRNAPPIARGSRVLVCSLDSRFGESFEADKSIYMRYYQAVDVALYSDVWLLLRAIGQGYDIVHLFCSLSSGGALADSTGATVVGSDLISNCYDAGVKLLWIASENSAEDYIRGFKLSGRALNLIMTVSRNGAGFSNFLDKLLSKVSSGELLPAAWARLAPQAEGVWQQNLPGCIFCAGRGGVKLLS